MKRSLLIALVVVLLGAPAAHAVDEPYAVESTRWAGTLADGDRYASWVHGHNVRVLDETTGTTASFPLPAECRPPDAIGAGVLAAICGKAFRLFDVATGTWSSVPLTGDAATVFNADSVGIDDVGAQWIALTVDVGYHSPNFPYWIDRVTGAGVGESSDLDKTADLDAPELWVPLCAPLTRRANPDYDDETQYGPKYIGPWLIGKHAIDLRHGNLVMRRCGTAKQRVLTRSKNWESAWFGGTRVSWIEQNRLRAVDGDPLGRGRVRTFDTKTGRFHSWPVPGAPNPNLYVTHTRRHVFLDKHSEGLTIHRYAIDL